MLQTARDWSTSWRSLRKWIVVNWNELKPGSRRETVGLNDLGQARVGVHRCADGLGGRGRDGLEVVRIRHVGADRLDDVFARHLFGFVAQVLRPDRLGPGRRIGPTARAFAVLQGVVDARELAGETLRRDV